MKTTRQFIILILTILTSMASVHAASPREELTQMVEQLQKTPTDNALREKIIKLAASIKPAPAIPDKAIEFEGRAQFAFKSAKSEADFITAAREYENAIAAAPWVPGYYADLCTIYEKASRFEDAKRNCELYLVGLTDPAQMTDVKRRIAGLTFGIEQAQKLAAEKKAEKDKIAQAKEDGRRAEQAKRDVITQIKKAVGNRTYEMKIPSYSETRQMDGVSDNELFQGGNYYIWEIPSRGIYPYWKFDDLHAELWWSNTGLAYRGESTGPDINDMRWSQKLGSTFTLVWGRFSLKSGRMYVGGGDKLQADYDPNRHYFVQIFDPK